MKLLKMFTPGRKAAAIRRFVFNISREAIVFVWKAVIFLIITMAVALTALAYKAALLAYRKIADRWSFTVRSFFETYFYAELRQRCSALEGRFDQVSGQLEQLKGALGEAAETQKEAEERTARRLEHLKAVIAEGNAFLKTMVSVKDEILATKEVAEYGIEGTFCHYHENLQPQKQVNFCANGGDHQCQLPLSPPLSTCNNHISSSLPSQGSGALPNGHYYPRNGVRRRSSCAFYGSEDESLPHSCSPTSPGILSSFADSQQATPPPPPPPPMPNFSYGKVSFKVTPRSAQQVSSSQAVKAAGFSITESEIAAMRNQLKKVPAERKETPSDEDED